MWSSYHVERYKDDHRPPASEQAKREAIGWREVALEAQRQRTVEQKERWQLEKWEWRIELGMKAICFLCALAALIIGSWSGEPTVLGGSGATGLVWLFWTLQRSSSDRRKGSERGDPSLSTDG